MKSFVENFFPQAIPSANEQVTAAYAEAGCAREDAISCLF
jgi:hypothetical protein